MRYQRVYTCNPEGYAKAFVDGMKWIKKVGPRFLAAKEKFSPFADRITPDRAIMANVFVAARLSPTGRNVREFVPQGPHFPSINRV